MRDPFRPNSNSQLIREAQFAFVVIVLLLGVLVYVAIHRVTGRRFQFTQIVQTAPLAQHINDNAYPAQAIRGHEEHTPQESNMARSVAQPESGAAKQKSTAVSATPTQTFSPHRQQSPPVVPARPVISPPKAATSSPSTPITPSVAQAQFIEPAKPVLESSPQRHVAISKTSKSVVEDPFERINKSSFNSAQSPSHIGTESKSVKGLLPSKPSVTDVQVSATAAADFLPPPIKSNFGAGSTRELPSFDAPIEKAPQIETAKAETAEAAIAKAATTEGSFSSNALQSLPKPQQSGVSSIVPPQDTALTFDPSFSAKKFQNANVTKTIEVPKTQIASTHPKPLGPQEYRVQATDSLWSIALDHYGDGRFFRALHQHNLSRVTSAGRLTPNTTLVIPKVAELLERYTKLCPADKLRHHDLNIGDSDDNRTANVDYGRYEKRMNKRFHITRSGDTLFDVARHRLGQASRYLEIFELNRFRIPQHANHLTPLDPGLRLLLPE